ncbi:WG repeat-containing protein [Herbaspirillum rubrisubalbicans]|uniref:WG repeat-containing protein n=1 Tax=Herbaspirillum rubrisubalbicans TaxID=80842 RepID=UPI0015598292|nr:WG repeat-containing protein [Herbaspirillum rubrisubalbicans]NQE51502.1 hypothetical protein [Herbaspirillum rubrisubalbicans]
MSSFKISALLGLLAASALCASHGIAQNQVKDYHAFCGGGKMGVFREDGEILLAPSYLRVDTQLEYGALRVSNGKGKGIVGLDGKIRMPLEYQMIAPLSFGRREVIKDGQAGLLDELGRPATSHAGEIFLVYSNGWMIIITEDLRTMLVNQNDEVIFQVEGSRGEQIGIDSSGIAIFSGPSENGWIDLRTQKVHQTKTDSVFIEQGVLYAQRADKSYVILRRQGGESRNVDAVIAITPDHKILTHRDGVFKLLAASDDEIADANASEQHAGRPSAYKFRRAGKWGLVNDKAEIILPPVYDFISLWHEGAATVQRNSLSGLVDGGGKLLVAVEFESVGAHAEGFTAVRRGGRWGYLDQRGKLVIDFQFDDVGAFENGIARVSSEGKVFLINTKGQAFIPLTYDQSSIHQENGLLKVTRPGSHCPDYLDTNGKPAFLSVKTADGDEQLIDVRQQRTLWSSVPRPAP